LHQENGNRRVKPRGTPARPPIRRQDGPALEEDIARIRPPKLAFTIVEAAASAGLSRSLLYELIRAGELNSFRVGGRRRRLIYADDLQAWLLNERAAGSGAGPGSGAPSRLRRDPNGPRQIKSDASALSGRRAQ
jgi:excisionase family DNA binding protein